MLVASCSSLWSNGDSLFCGGMFSGSLDRVSLTVCHVSVMVSIIVAKDKEVKHWSRRCAFIPRVLNPQASEPNMVTWPRPLQAQTGRDTVGSVTRFCRTMGILAAYHRMYAPSRSAARKASWLFNWLSIRGSKSAIRTGGAPFAVGIVIAPRFRHTK